MQEAVKRAGSMPACWWLHDEETHADGTTARTAVLAATRLRRAAGQKAVQPLLKAPLIERFGLRTHIES